MRFTEPWLCDGKKRLCRLCRIFLEPAKNESSRYVLSWKLSNTLAADFCVEALNEALEQCQPEIFNTDQGSQYASSEFLKPLKARGIKISMDSKGRALDNIFVERLWRSVKYEEVYISEYRTAKKAFSSLKKYFVFYNNCRFHQALNYKTPAEVHYQRT
uniref:Integrase catalytic domain-containing protein n=1 Tax=uncultured Desulfobacterium sp. TaxID=201089 RepID=E1YH69_9BACT|nr:hypothetical protein N47_F16080 [uncultured Desulfobacterium sp.]